MITAKGDVPNGYFKATERNTKSKGNKRLQALTAFGRIRNEYQRFGAR